MVDLRKVFKRPLNYSIISSVIQVITVIISVSTNVIGYFWVLVLIGVTGTINIVANLKEKRQVKNRDHLIETILELAVKNIGANESGKYRAAIMLPDVDNNFLTIKHQYNMVFHNDRLIKIKPATGCAGKAYNEKRPIIGDIRTHGHEYYGLDAEQIKFVWKDMKTIISNPLFDSAHMENQNVIGVFNIDTSKELEQSGFQDTKVGDTIRDYSALLSLILSGEF
ncbi:MAG: GAF domain-containing protein [Candidatus Methanoperedens sp.]|nr:GAF domain-containing protein [Candidatus Methanoperedens sp.]